MILEELKLLKSFGNSLDSTVTEEDIAAKERELGIELPEALRELYLTFNPEDPIFSLGVALVPLTELRLAVIRRKYHLVTCLPIFRTEDWTAGAVLWMEDRSTGQINAYYRGEDDQYVGFYKTHPKTKREREACDVPDFYKLPKWLLDRLAQLRLYTMPNIIGIVDHPSSGERQKIWALFDTFSVHAYLSKDGILGLSQMGLGTLCDMPFHEIVLGGHSEADLERLMQSCSEKFVWLKRAGSLLAEEPPKLKEPPVQPTPPKARDLYSITPILEFLRAFGGVTEPGLSQAELEKAEDKLGPLPLPVREYYALFPKAYYKTHNTLRPLSGLRKTKSGIFFFLEENQDSCQWGFSLDTPFLYCRVESKWEVSDYLDTFLAQEFAFELMSREELGLEFAEVDDIKPEVMAPDGALGSRLQEIAGLSHKLAWGFGVELFQSMDGGVVFLYNHGSNSGFFMSKDSGALERLTNLL